MSNLLNKVYSVACTPTFFNNFHAMTKLCSNSLVCYFEQDSDGLVQAFKDKSQVSFLLQFFKKLKPVDIDFKRNWIVINLEKQVDVEFVDWSFVHFY